MLPTLDAPELVFGLCSPVGTDNGKVEQLLLEQLLVYNYQTTVFKVTDLMKEVVIPHFDLCETPLDARYDAYIRYANELRHLTGLPSALAMMCCAAVRGHRRRKTKSPNTYLPRSAYIFNQFKRKEEIEALRQVYGRLFFAISIYSDKSKRLSSLANRLASDHSGARVTKEYEHNAGALITRDENEEGVPTGQRLRDAFPLADLFINIDDIDGARRQIHRFLQGLFGSNLVSPTREEYGMYIAQGAALRSLDLSRQVGAAIFSNKGDIVSLGCNEVPKAGGGTYWTQDDGDARDYTIGHDENERVKKALLADVVRRLDEGGFINNHGKNSDIVKFVMDESMKKDSVLREALLMDLLEFGRAIHAEMSAITDAARTGRAIADTTLYCTTFPCHICAKHIIAAGIEKVVFIEPYPKSYAEELHKEIYVGTTKPKEKRVQFAPFIGVSPRRFKELFERGRRKTSDGKLSEWIGGKPKLIVNYTLATYLYNEEAFTKILEDKLKTLAETKRIELAQSALRGRSS